MKGYAGGRLFDAKRSPFGVAMTPVQCIHYVLTRPAVAAIMAGMETVSQVRDAVHYEEATEEEKDYATILAGAPKYAFEGQCTYCGHCSPCPMEIDIAAVNKFYDLAAAQPDVPESVRSHYASLGHTASECVGCGGCEYICPARPHRAIYIEGNPEHVQATPPPKEETVEVEEVDFGF
jgi:predicted aldo/keto reductase-like oxidoreductase